MNPWRCGMLVLVGILGWTLLFFLYFSWSIDSHSSLLLAVVDTRHVQLSARTLTTMRGQNDSSVQRQVRLLPPAMMLPQVNKWRRARRPLDFEFFSEGRQAVHALWKGQASADMLSFRLQEAKKSYTGINPHNVTYTGSMVAQRGTQDLLCQLKRQQLRTVDGTEEPFAKLGWRQLVPGKPLQQLRDTPYRTCAVVTSAGALLRSSLGKEIDSHDAVLRFNAAPTRGFEDHVGSKTTIRIINSQILADSYHFASSSLYKNITLLAWDPTSYSANLEKWYSKPDYDLFPAYVERRRSSPSQLFYILHPAFIWHLWDVLQNNIDEDIQPNPPSSGFIGIIVMLSLCEKVDIYEFIPSRRHTTLCHYYDYYHDMACTLGAYHPLLYEKLLVRRMTETSMDDLSNNGKAVLSGFSQITC
ncbi:beta-galactoside alpha-2,6-sialyltransferase 2b [Electrophorus electricus]|uniref:Beta-galactoside alpha-2,6-sialyltransferase 2 n=1 Tax=Electrophorus electricus TaxID=8005 RepID=A0A4W4GRT8_ELEEL|nr:beta-galactoside alpha-2,6-sialyltransferase 2b [Electrophorus electricus]XP_035389713.1 beta-galactoside alpha-2,6-sialyltransferase 2b [Electrophorus electricus]XP_035389724.1 beta-galactoside alpha-2,6-sialyltransferase 2b [Electrophorus electricus]XP_035389755.1 beta-galactoside alpha-2,6-sialyltransferase 2b [Electrophorus electricus]